MKQGGILLGIIVCLGHIGGGEVADGGGRHGGDLLREEGRLEDALDHRIRGQLVDTDGISFSGFIHWKGNFGR